ncbi:hypothetical protein BASA50_000629 [Batrachochytrium salamandrivorans]|uniref:Uncharacterized protein n=1 Tax=Batrachochytrium salamandrivorans TaxID=1357716 RepID=A0ABQ8ET37_9FUNG|nr:hypothetical protein BASA50_000629 [Batrachochytrium salamandrivorans]
MRLISFAMVSFLAITVSAWPPHNPDTHDMNQPPDAATQDTEQFQDMQELLDGFFQNLQQSQNAATQSSQQSQEPDTQMSEKFLNDATQSAQQSQGFDTQDMQGLLDSFFQAPQQSLGNSGQDLQQSLGAATHNMHQSLGNSDQNIPNVQGSDIQMPYQTLDDDIQILQQIPDAATQNAHQSLGATSQDTHQYQGISNQDLQQSLADADWDIQRHERDKVRAEIDKLTKAYNGRKNSITQRNFHVNIEKKDMEKYITQLRYYKSTITKSNAIQAKIELLKNNQKLIAEHNSKNKDKVRLSPSSFYNIGILRIQFAKILKDIDNSLVEQKRISDAMLQSSDDALKAQSVQLENTIQGLKSQSRATREILWKYKYGQSMDTWIVTFFSSYMQMLKI